MADDEIVVEIEEEKAPVVEKVVTATDPIADLKAQHDELVADRDREKQAAETARQQAAAERQRAAVAEKEVETARTEVAESRIGSVETGLSAAQTEADAAQADYTAAMEAGDWKRAGEAQRKMARAESTIGRLNEAKATLEVEKTTPPVRREAAPVVQADPLETFIAGRSAPTQAWLRAHPDEARALALGTDSRRAAKLTAADSDAVAEGFARDTPEYFSHVEKFLGLTKPNGKTNGNGATQQRRASAPVAPVQASAGGTNGGTEVRLSKGEAASATDGTLTWNYDDPSGQKRFKKGEPIGVAEFARRKLALQQSGQYDKSMTES